MAKTRVGKRITIENTRRTELFECGDCKVRVAENQMIFQIFTHFRTGCLIEDGRCKNCDDAFIGN